MEVAQVLLEGYTIEHTAKKMRQGFAKVLNTNNIDITVDQWIILDILSITDSISQLNIAEKSGKDSPTVTRILDILEKKKILYRNPDSRDRRRFLISLSPKGKKIIKRVKPMSLKYRSTCYKNIKISDLENLRNILNTITENLENI